MSTSEDFDRMVMEFMQDDPCIAHVVRQNQGTYNPTTGEYTAVDINIPVNAIMLDLTLGSNGLGNQPNSLIQAGDKVLYIQPTEKANPIDTPLVLNPSSDKILLSGFEYNIMFVKEVNPSAGNVILYQLIIRR